MVHACLPVHDGASSCRVGAVDRRTAALERHLHRPRCGNTLAEGKDAEVTTLAQAMTPDPITISPDSRAIDTTILARY